MQSDPQEIAKRLSEAQKRALLWLPEDGTAVEPKGRLSVSVHSLSWKGLADYAGRPPDMRMRLTPLGLAVRTALVARLPAEEGDAP